VTRSPENSVCQKIFFSKCSRGSKCRLELLQEGTVGSHGSACDSSLCSNDVDLCKAAAALAALGNKLRLKLWTLLLPHGSEGLSAGTISAQLAVAPSALAVHLQEMAEGGVLLRHSGRAIYAVNSEVAETLRALLSPPALLSALNVVMDSGALAVEQPSNIVSDG
jgi:hypothetical protein